MFLPEQILIHVGTDCSHAIVNVHKNMDEAVDEGKEGAMATGCELDSPPDTHGHDTVMYDMQR